MMYLWHQKLKGDTACDLFWATHLSKNLRGTLLAICDLGSLFIKKIKGDTACDLRFRKFTYPKPMGDTACDLRFSKFIYPKTYGGH